MKKLSILFILLLCVATLFAQAPEKFTFQAVVRNASNQLVASATVGVRASILQGGVNGTLVYMETHTAITNTNGLVTLQIGGGSVQQGIFADIDWENGIFFLKTEIDPNGGSDYSIISTQQLLSVPYALYSKEAGNGFSGDYNDLTNLPQIPQNVSELTNDAGYITLDAVPAVPTNVSAFTNDAGYLTGYTEADPQFNAWDKDYNDLINTPEIPTVPNNVSTFVNDIGYITMDSVPSNVSAFTNDAGYLTAANVQEAANIPTNVSAFTNDAGYITAEDVPVQVNADWNATSGVAQILNKPELFSGDYNDLTNKPDPCECLTAADVQALINSSLGAMQQQLDSLQNVVDALTGGSTTATLPTVITSMVNNITETTATCGGNVTSDGGAMVTERGVCWSTSATPTIADAHTSDGAGLGTFTSSLTGLMAGTTYYVRAYATNSAGTAYGVEVSFTTLAVGGGAVVDEKSCPGTPTVTDHEGNVYVTVQIGDQCWMRENLRTTHYSDGTAIPAGGDNISYTEPYYYDYSSNSLPLETRGYLYNWPAVMHNAASSSANPSGVQGICPTGWHLPSDAEWTQLTDYVGSQSEYTCGGNTNYIAKALASTEGWNSYSWECYPGDQSMYANNATGFSAVPAGACSGSSFANAGYSAFFWSSTEGSSLSAYNRDLDYADAGVDRSLNSKSYGRSVRCLRDSIGGGGATVTLPTVTTSAVSNIMATTVTCGGEVTSDGGDTVTARGVCWGTSQNPTVSDSHTTDGSGTGSFTSSITGLEPNTTYSVRAYATNSAGTAYGEQRSFSTSASSFACGNSTVTDYDGNTYNTVQIGQQCWMKENLRTTHYANGDSIGLYSGTLDTRPHRYYPQNIIQFVPTYGYLYNWLAVMHDASSSNSSPSGVQGICPNGWHVPSEAEWTQLINFVGDQTQYTCDGDDANIAKALSSTSYWQKNANACAVGNDPNTNNKTGFSVIPTGKYYYSTDYGPRHGYYYQYFGKVVSFWSATEWVGNSNQVHCLLFSNDSSKVSEKYFGKEHSLGSVRCLRDEGGTTSWTTVTTAAPDNISSTSAICGGTVTVNAGGSVTERGVCWSVSPHPTTDDSHISNGSGTGDFTCNLSGLTANTTYYVRAYAINSYGTAYGDEVTFMTFTCGIDNVTDYDGNTYNTVQVGNQCWMRENLRTTQFADSRSIPLYDNYNPNRECRYIVGGSLDEAVYGYLYNFLSIIEHEVCPPGWHVPSISEWVQLINYVKTKSQHICGENNNNIAKAMASKTGWNNSTNSCAVGNTPSTNNTTLFSAFPAGYSGTASGDISIFGSISKYANVEEGEERFWAVAWSYDTSATIYYTCIDVVGTSVRCIRDVSCSNSSSEETLELPTVSTSAVSGITENSASCGGNVTSDGGATVTARGVCWSTSQNPTASDSHTTDGTGTGSFTSSITGLTAGTTYYVRAYATNSAGTAYGEQRSFTTGSSSSFACGTSMVSDYDGNVYNTVQIGQQCWMRENLRTTHYADGTAIPAGGSNTSDTSPYHYDYSSSGIDLTSRGYLYNWPAAMHGAASSNANPSGVQGICPTGWHLPSDAEWNTMEASVSGSDWQESYATSTGWRGSHAGKLAGGDGWATSSTSGAPGDYSNADRNASGFSAVPAGRCHGSSFYSAGDYASFWSSAEIGSYNAWSRYLYYANAGVYRTNDNKSFGFSVRCLRDETGTAVIDEKSCSGTPTVTDHEGNVYNTVQIGNQCWMRENLRTTTSPSTGTYLIPAANADYTYTGKQARWYNNDSATYAPMNYGLLYNWSAAVDTFNTAYGETSVNTSGSNAVSVNFTGNRRGICPAGWHLPSDAEWTQLTDYVGSQSEYTCGGSSSNIAKALASETGWGSYTNTCAVGNDQTMNNATGFSAVPAGYSLGSSFGYAGGEANFWSSTQSGSYGAYGRLLNGDDAGVYRNYTVKGYGHSVRCLRD